MTAADFFNALSLAIYGLVIIGLVLAFVYIAFEEEKEK